MRSNKFDKDDAVVVVNMHDRSKVVAADVEDDPIISNKTGVPLDLALQFIPYPLLRFHSIHLLFYVGPDYYLYNSIAGNLASYVRACSRFVARGTSSSTPVYWT